MGKGTGLSLGRGTSYLGGQQVPSLPGSAVAGDWGLAPMANAGSLTWPANLNASVPVASGGTVSSTSGSTGPTPNPALNQNISWVLVLVFLAGCFLLYRYVKA